MKKSIWILCLAFTIAGCFAFCKTVYADPTFGSNSSTLTNPYMPMKLGDRRTYKSYGYTVSVFNIYVDAVAQENIDQVKCLKIKKTSSFALRYTDYYWFAQDTSGSIWILQELWVDGNNLMYYGRNGAKLVMPSQVSVGAILWSDEFLQYETVVNTGVTVPQLSTGFGPYYNCIKSMMEIYSGRNKYFYYAPNVGQIKTEDDISDVGLPIRGLEISSFTNGSQIGVFRPSNGMWFFYRNKRINFGIQEDLPVTGDWNGDGTTKIGAFRPSIGWWFLDYNGNGLWDGCSIDRCYNLGISEDTPVTGDWNGDGITEIGVFRKSIGWWFLDYNADGTWSGCSKDRCYNFGISEDTPVTGDWNGDGKTEIGVFRPSIGWWFVDVNGEGTWSGCGTDGCYNFGISEDLPVTGDWNGDGFTEIGVFRPSIGYWFLDYNGNDSWNDCTTDRCYQFGISVDVPVSGSF